ncbi:MAG: phosphatidate cytidylyltransferase [Cycloclasticus sp.]
MSSLVQRLLTAAVLIPVVVWLVMFSPDMAFISILSIIIIIAAYEWGALSGLKSNFKKYVLAGVVVLLSHGLTVLSVDVTHYLMYTSLFFWSLVIVLIIVKPQFLLDVKINQPLMLLLGIIVVSLTFISLCQIRFGFVYGPDLLMYLLLLIWIADSGAFFAGRAFGKHKLSPIISPGKSIEGVVGGLLACLLFAFLGANHFAVESAASFILISVYIAFVSVFGDLFESLMKRRANVKDSGAILPGHGGILDRIDSLIAAAPVFVACVLLTKMFS